ncbi:hypothetical protein SLNHY_1830 [Streptomyces albus]|nr:hypothetical protein SLNHY_1830 [Streptomyces albus]
MGCRPGHSDGTRTQNAENPEDPEIWSKHHSWTRAGSTQVGPSRDRLVKLGAAV